MLRLRDVSFSYPGEREVLDHVDLTLEEGELCLVVGRTGSGKSTLLGAVGNGLVPHFHRRAPGRSSYRGRSSTCRLPASRAGRPRRVGRPGPTAGFVTDTVEDELAYTMENLGMEPDHAAPRGGGARPHGPGSAATATLRFLSAGEQQRVAIGAVLTASPKVLVLDEPTSALDPASAEEVLAALTRLVHDVGSPCSWPSTVSSG